MGNWMDIALWLAGVNVGIIMGAAGERWRRPRPRSGDSSKPVQVSARRQDLTIGDAVEMPDQWTDPGPPSVHQVRALSALEGHIRKMVAPPKPIPPPRPEFMDSIEK